MKIRRGLGGLLVGAIAVQATAAQDAPAQSSLLEEVVVTAQKRSENLQSTPIALSALTDTLLEERSINTLEDMTGLVPGLVIGGKAGYAGLNPLSIRGVSGQAIPIGAEEAVGMYLDGVYLPRSDAAFFSLIDVERIEVLRGPQGTLYGRNSTAGAVNVITQTPESQLTAKVDASYGRFDEYSVKGYVSGPLSSQVAASLSAVKSGHDGYFENAVTGNDVGDTDDVTVRGKLRYASGEDVFTGVLAFDYTRLEGADFYQNQRDPVQNVFTGIGDPSVVESNWEDVANSWRKSYGPALTLNYSLNDKLTLTSISSYRVFEARSYYDTTGGVYTGFVLHTQGFNRMKTISEELRLGYTGDRLKLTVGANYYHEDNEFWLVNTAVDLPYASTSPKGPHDTMDTTAYAVFGQVDYEVLPRLTLVAGGRLNYEKRDFVQSYDPIASDPVFRSSTGDLSDTEFVPKLAVNFQATPDIFLYASASKGYQAGGFNPSSGRLRQAESFKPEDLTAYEVGAKTELFERRVRLNSAAFYYDYKDMQVRQTLGPGLATINNAGAATIYGAELEATVVVGGGVTLGGFVNHLDSEYEELIELVGGVPIDRSGNRLNRAPSWQYGVHVDYTHEWRAGLRLNANASYYHESKSYYDASNSPFVANDGWETVDARLAVSHANGIEVYVFGKNLTDDRYIAHVIPVPPNYYAAYVNAPRRYGIGMKYSF